MGKILAEDKNQLDLLMNLNSTKLLDLSQKFQLYPESTVSLEEFVQMMEQVFHDTKIAKREDFV